MSGIQRENKPESSVSQQGMVEFQESLKCFCELCRSSVGPSGKVKFIQNSVGGCLTVTSISRRLFSSISIQTPILKVLTSTAQSHLSNYGDGGMFYASLASGLILKGINSGIRTKILSEIFETLLTYCLDFLNSKSCPYRYSANFSDLKFMSSLVQNILGTKPLCRLNSESQKHLTVLILECFLNSVSENENCAPSDNIYVTTDHAENVNCSKTYPGILLAAPELSRFKLTPLSPCKVMLGGKSVLKVALVTASMSGDLDEIANLKLDVEGDADVDTSVVDNLSHFCDAIVQSGVGVMLCQRVIHPHLKKQLRTKNLLVVDRIGLQPIQYIAKLSGASPVGCLDMSIQESQLGWIDNVKHNIISDKSFVQLIKRDNPVTTLVLTHPQEQPLYEIKEVTSAALTSLDHLLREPFVLSGGGCWQAGLAQRIKQLVQVDGQTVADKLELPRRTLSEACGLFSDAVLDSSAQSGKNVLFNNTNGHLFYKSQVVPRQSGHRLTKETHCCCGLMTLGNDDSLAELKMDNKGGICEAIIGNSETISGYDEHTILWDSLSVRVNALKMAVLSASAVLRIGQVLENS